MVTFMVVCRKVHSDSNYSVLILMALEYIFIFYPTCIDLTLTVKKPRVSSHTPVLPEYALIGYFF